ncbi:cupin domain-containing protein [Luxibacter massiliensis]|uniref:cupin domain-containing protein n=1 Tax=Luxibacter massiliensis TaxID=2219695 RepID=UPI000F050EFB|nr:cupin domain-containing protein [Luxibacter massiliensis]
MNRVFSVAEAHKPKDGLTISTPSKMQGETDITYFSLGKETDITPETYARPVIYIGMGGQGIFTAGTGENQKKLEMKQGEMLVILKDTLCGAATTQGFVYTEIMPGKEIIMNHVVKAGEVLKLGELLPYEDGSIVNMDIVSNDGMKFVLMAFDEGTGLSPHRAPGDALVFALEGKAVIGYEGTDHEIQAGESFHFAKNGLHSVKADGKFKMALLIALK